MKLTLKRSYFREGTNGELWYAGHLIGYTIELPWLDNLRNHSCIPEESYQLAKRYTPKRGWHLYVRDVPGRSGILIHPANDALKELRGCLAPVSRLTGRGRGSMSGYATDKLEKLVFHALDHHENVMLNIKKKEPMNIIKRAVAPTPKFFRVIRRIGLALAAAGGAVMAAPVALPAGIVTLGGYLVVAGGVLAAVSQVTVDEPEKVSSDG